MQCVHKQQLPLHAHTWPDARKETRLKISSAISWSKSRDLPFKMTHPRLEGLRRPQTQASPAGKHAQAISLLCLTSTHTVDISLAFGGARLALSLLLESPVEHLRLRAVAVTSKRRREQSA